MKNLFENYIQSISSKFSHEETSEMGYRTDFELLIKGIFESIKVKRIDHDARAKQGNKPDFIVLNNDVPILYIEAKDIGVSLDKVEKSEQMARYYGYANLVLTDYVEFRFYRNGIRYEEPIKVANFNLKSRTISSIPENYEHVAKSLIDFAKSHKEPIRSGKHLAKIMGGKAQRIRDNMRQFLTTLPDNNSELTRVYETIKKLLVHDLTLESFADMYAQTLVYGLFVARYHDATPDTFSRQEARDLIPASNPFLGHFFDHIAGRNFEKRLTYIVDELCEVFSHADVQKLMKEYFKDDLWGKTHRGPDPVIHFYEDFLKEYDEALRKKMGAYYTPLPVVQFIVSSVDYLLEKEFGLSSGLADTSKTEDGIHRVQVLDPAVGTGTFISNVIDQIYTRILKNKQQGRWPTYVHHDLLPRLHGFELMMAPYTIAHLKISMALKETGFMYFNETRAGKSRLGIYLTNSLEEVSRQPELLAFDFAASIAEEAKEASKIKNEKPIMVVVGNPPYSVSSSNKGKWISDLIDVYKKDLDEKNIQPLSDDYIKFIRFAEHFIEKNKIGIVAMITNNAFLDGIIHRQMRKHLLETFDDIYILNLHGNSKKKEKAPDGGNDENVFDIQQGVSINIFIRKNEQKKSLAKTYYTDLYGKRECKFEKLNNSSFKNIEWQTLNVNTKQYLLVPTNFEFEEEYNRGFKVNELFTLKSSGIKTHNDENLIADTARELEMKVKKIGINFNDSKVKIYAYRPFENKYVYYDTKVLGRAREKTIHHLFEDNLGLILVSQPQAANLDYFDCSFISNKPTDTNLFRRGGPVVFPLHLYNEDGIKTLNLKKVFVAEIEKIVDNLTPEDIIDYIYAYLHSPSYREKFKEFLKIDFPRVPYPQSVEQFKELATLGRELRSLHLLESPKVNQFITTYPTVGSDTIEKLSYENEKVFINDNQYFGEVPEVAWNFYIGGYQPAQKWLKDRKGQSLTNEDIEHYQKMIVALVETDRVMKKIDLIKPTRAEETHSAIS